MARSRCSWLVPILILLAAEAQAQDATSAGAVSTPYPTFHNLSIEWAIGGDFHPLESA